MAYIPVNIIVKESVVIQGINMANRSKGVRCKQEINMACMPGNITMQQQDGIQCMYLTHMQMGSVDKEETSIAHMPTNFSFFLKCSFYRFAKFFYEQKK